jgi:hypothetical protein
MGEKLENLAQTEALGRVLTHKGRAGAEPIRKRIDAFGRHRTVNDGRSPAVKLVRLDGGAPKTQPVGSHEWVVDTYLLEMVENAGWTLEPFRPVEPPPTVRESAIQPALRACNCGPYVGWDERCTNRLHKQIWDRPMGMTD